MAYCGWANNVNREILDSTTVSVGDGATVSESLESGGIKKSRLLCSNAPDKFSVTMAFDFSTPIYNGYTELDLFYSWYKNIHKYGTVPFEFPSILINSNRQKGFSQEEISWGKQPDREFYCITSAVEGTKEGLSQKITMTWETYATGTIQVEDEEYEMDNYSVSENGYIRIQLTRSPVTLPNSSTWSVMKSSDNGSTWSSIAIKNCFYNSEEFVATLVYEPLTSGTYLIKIDDENPKTLVV